MNADIMIMKRKTLKFAFCAAAVLVVAAAEGALRAWEPRDYVRSSLMLHLDGIRNVGADAAHSTNATTWVDLSGNSRDASLTIVEGGSGNVWKENGFYFNTSAVFVTSAAFTFGTNYTFELLVDAPGGASGQPLTCATFVSHLGGYVRGAVVYKQGALTLLHQTDNLIGNAWNTRSGIYSPASFTYLTAVRNGTRACVFTGTEYPTNTENSSNDHAMRVGWSYGSKTVTSAAVVWSIGGYLEGGDSAEKPDNKYVKGTMKSVRLYDKMLTEAELAWNRAIDDSRFFTKARAIAAEPVAGAIPDAVVATAVAGAEGVEECGSYVVDETAGHVFTAVSASVGGTVYACTGYTLEAWDADAGAWGPAVPHPGEYACAVASGDKVRITWQWSAASGTLVPAVMAYVQDGLKLHYDAICNDGALAQHNPDATRWRDLSESRNDLVMCHYDGNDVAVEGLNGKRWLSDGFDFDSYSYGATARSQELGTNYSVQILCDVTKNNLTALEMPDGATFFGGGKLQSGSIWFKKDSTLQYIIDDGIGTLWNTRSYLNDTAWKYITGLRKGDRTALITGTTVPADDALNRVTGWSVGTKNVSVGAITWYVGGHMSTAGRTNGHVLMGVVKSVRVYDHVMSNEELARNRTLDEMRFFGAKMPGTVEVANSIAGMAGREPDGTYVADGWTFIAGTTTNSVRGIDWACVGCVLQTWDAATSSWGAETRLSATEWTSPSGNDFAPCRLTWLWQPVRGARRASGYTTEDYVPSELLFHLDGISNAGIGAAHDLNAATWKDLSGNGFDASLNVHEDGTGNEWREDGFYFNASAAFVTTASFGLGTEYTMQILADAPTSQPNTFGTFVSPGDFNTGTILYKKSQSGLLHQTDDTIGNVWDTRPGIEYPPSFGYMTAVRDESRACIFTGTEYPVNTTNEAGYVLRRGWCYGTKNSVALAKRWTVGAFLTNGVNPNVNYFLKGKIKSVRVYERVLSEDELAWNRKVDNARFFGMLSATNVVVEGKFDDYAGDAPGAYEVFGSHTFTASDATDNKGKSRKILGYTVQAWNGSDWGEAVEHAGGAYEHVVGTSPAKVLLTWRWQSAGTVVIMR